MKKTTRVLALTLVALLGLLTPLAALANPMDVFDYDDLVIAVTAADISTINLKASIDMTGKEAVKFAANVDGSTRTVTILGGEDPNSPDGGSYSIYREADGNDAVADQRLLVFGEGLGWIGDTPFDVTVTDVDLSGGKGVTDPIDATHGGALFVQGNLTVEGCMITGNSASQGGAIYVLGDLTLDKSASGNVTTLAGNMAEGAGGAAFALGDATTKGSTVLGGDSAQDGNTAKGGNGGALASNGDTTIKDAIFTGNVSQEGAGGAVFTDGKNNATKAATITGSTFDGNSTDMYPASGGAVYSDNPFGLNIDDCTLTNNVAAGNGGAIGSTGPVIITGGTLTDNHAGGAGGAIFIPELISDAPVTLDGVTVTGNISDEPGTGGAVHALASEVTVTGGTILANNTPDGRDIKDKHSGNEPTEPTKGPSHTGNGLHNGTSTWRVTADTALVTAGGAAAGMLQAGNTITVEYLVDGMARIHGRDAFAPLNALEIAR